MQTESSTPQTRPGMLAGVFLAGVIVGVGAMALYSGRESGEPSSSPTDTVPPTTTQPPDTLPAAMCGGLVKLSIRGGLIVADPDPVCLAVGRPLTWEIVDKGTVTITFVDLVNQKLGPFQEDQSLFNAYDNTKINEFRGIYEVKNLNATTVGSLSVKTLGADNSPDTARQWKYQVRWRPLTGPAPPDLDPVVCIRR